ncbi:hypothetical protein [Ruminococcus sp. 2227st1_E6_2227SCRN_220401]
MDRKAMYKLSYGLFILNAKEAEKDNGCVKCVDITSTRKTRQK